MSKFNFVSVNKEDTKIISVEIDIEFYHSRALRHLLNKNYEKALKCYWKIIELEPDNPVHYFSIANILSDMGLHRKSNEILLNIVEQLEYDMPECYYFLANNYMLLDDEDSALVFVQQYIEIAPDGDFIPQAMDMKSYIIDKKMIKVEEESRENREKVILFINAKELLDAGKYEEAIDKFERLLEIDENHLAARNDLSLAYFYIEKYEEAIIESNYVLEQDYTNIHALCNLTVFYKQLEVKDKFEYLLNNLRKIVPYSSDQVYKLATTFAILGEHDLVFKHLSRLVNKGLVQDITFLHYCALAAFNTRRYDFARKCWEQIRRMDKDPKIARYYLEVILTQDSQVNDIVLPSSFYQYKLPLEEITDICSKYMKSSSSSCLYCSLLWILINGDIEEKEQVILSLKILDNSNSEQILRTFLTQESESEYLKKKVIVTLEQMKARPPYCVNLEGNLLSFDYLCPDFKLWNNKMLEVSAKINSEINDGYSLVEFYDAKLIWYRFVNVKFPNFPKIDSVNSWVAAIEYIVAKQHERPISYFMLSQKYGVSNEDINSALAEISKSLGFNEFYNRLYC